MKSSEDFKQLLQELYDEVYFIVSPPRCSSTAFARVFWEHPSVGYYSHEPFEATYYEQKPLADVYERLKNALDLSEIKANKQSDNPRSLVIKEMPYQVGDYFSMAQSWAKRPVIFLVRDPRLNIQSRIRRKLDTGDSPFFPLKETGWELLQDYINYCKENAIDYRIVDATDFRSHPKEVFKKVFAAFGLPFFEEQLNWKADQNIEIDNLGGTHTHLYKKVLGSSSIRPADEEIPALESFTEEQGVREHVSLCLSIYEKLKQDANFISPMINTMA